MASAVEEFRAFLLSLGLQPKVVAPDGKWRRCGTDRKPRSDRGAYKLMPHGNFGMGYDLTVHPCPVRWKPGKAVELPRFDPAAHRRALEEQRREQARAVEAARAFYEKCEPLRGSHPYLEEHGLGVEGCEGLRVDADGWLVVPAYRARQVASLQRISPDGAKLFWKGAPFKGALYGIRRPRSPQTLTVLCEGLATGLAIYAAIRITSHVVVAFTASGLRGAADRVKRRVRQGLVVVAADNDHRTVCPKHKDAGLAAPVDPWQDRPDWCLCNPGRAAGEAAAEVLGCGSARPEGIDGTDWCDFRTEHTTARLDRRYRETESDIRRAVDAEIEHHIRRHARPVVV